MTDPRDETPELPDAIEERLYELLLGEGDASAKERGLRDLIAAHPAHGTAILALAGNLRGGALALGALPAVAPTAPPTSIGPYQIVRKLGEGGFGTVWLATQSAPLQRQVAVKQIRAGMDTERVLRRFETERKALQQLDHPGIAKVLDAGRDDAGRPFLVMEFVDGLPLLAHCQQRRLPLRARLELLLALVDAVQHAHQRGILHRDLKPANLLVTELDGRARPRIIDFGLARVLDDDAVDVTREQQLIGTPEYMSPEQLRGSRDLDVRVDVHALGMILFELLVGDLPIPRASWRSSSASECIERALEFEPPAPSSRIADPALRRQVRGELDWIALQALARERDRRYRSAAEFGDDLRRFLCHEPVLAGPPGLGYELRKFVRRHRAAVAAGAAAFVALGAGLFVALDQRALAERRASEAARHLADYDRLADALQLEEVTATAKTLWPASPANAPALRRELERLQALAARREAHAATLARLRPAAAAGGADERRDFLRNRLELLLAALDRAMAPQGVGPSLQARLEYATTVQARSIDDVAAAWRTAAEEVRADPRFRGLALAPQLGLVPIGRDARSGLQEFVHLASGAVPVRDAAGNCAPCGEHGVVFVLLPGGTFAMGAQPFDPTAPNHDPEAGPDAMPITAVELTPFFFAKYELTRAQYERLTGEDPSFDPAFPDRTTPAGALYPVTRVSWDAATRLAWQQGLALPTEAQWEYACRAGTTTRWYTGDDELSLQGHANVGDLTYASQWNDDRPASRELEDGFVTSSPIGTFLPNAFGLFDVHGNVGEPCIDQFPRYTEPCRPGDGLRVVPPRSRDGRILRGGSFFKPASFASSARRDGNLPDATSMWIGVRLARRLDP